MGAKPSARERIIDAAEQVVLKEGASHMTMDAVAAKAGVSKGGLIYHFSSQRDLLQAMLQRFIDRMEVRMAQSRARLPDTPARNIKAYIHAWFTLGGEYRRTASALLAAVTREPELLKTVQQKHRTVLTEIIEVAQKPELAVVLSLATEGMWMSELLDISPLTASERERIQQMLLKLADEWLGQSNNSASRKCRTSQK
jgi:AcrR family transcriptional regulator